MNYKDKAVQLVKNMHKGIGTSSNELTLMIATNCARTAVNEISEAIQITTGHCTLRRLEQQEVTDDLKYWSQVLGAIDTVTKEDIR